MLTWEIIGIVFVVAFGALIVGRRLRANVFSVLLAGGIGALAMAVAAAQVQQYRSQRASSGAIGATQPLDVASAPAPAPVAWKTMAPMVKPPTGAASPPAAQNPAFGR